MAHNIVFITLGFTLLLFIWGRIRHDFVALIALFTLVMFGIVSPTDAFMGFGHPAVITVAAVLIIGKALEFSGLIDLLGRWVNKVGNNFTIQILTLTLLVALSSAFMNNVGALAIFMPVAIHIAKQSNRPPSLFLMPIAFASLLGGMITLIGTPPNIIIASFRADYSGEPFGMFAFTPVGLGIAILGVLFISLLGWRLLPRRGTGKHLTESFKIDDYITEVRVTPESPIVGKSIADLDDITKADAQILGLIRKNKLIHAPDENEELAANDIIIIECDKEALKSFVAKSKLEFTGDKVFRKEAIGSKNITIEEAVVMADSPLVGQSSSGIRMRNRYGVNLLAVARRQKQIHNRLDNLFFRTGDVLMLQGRTSSIKDAMTLMGCLPLVQKGQRFRSKSKVIISVSLFISSIVLIIAGVLPAYLSFPLAAIAMGAFGILPLKNMYTSIDWTVIILLGAMIPVGEALETSGGASLIGGLILDGSRYIPPWATLVILLTVTMLLSGVINNAATVVLMAPIGIVIAKGMNLSVDPFLMTIAIGASASFLTPIAHQSNTLVMGPGRYRFVDYLKLGVPMTLIVIIIAVPLILFFWPV